MTPPAARVLGVGPVLVANDLGQAVLAAIRYLNADVQVVDRGAYFRVLTPERCRLSRTSVEELTGLPFELPADLEAVMPSFQGVLTIQGEWVEWS